MEERRKKLMVDRGLQIRYSLLMVIILLVFSVLTGFTLYYSIKFGLLAAQLGSYAEEKIILAFSRLRVLFVIESIVFILLAIIVGIRFSLRIAGPSYHLKEGLREIAGGNYAIRLKFRKRDELKEVAEEFNRMAQILGEKTKQS